MARAWYLHTAMISGFARKYLVASGMVPAFAALAMAQPLVDEFAQSIRPVLARNCAVCHTAKSRVNFLKAENAKGIEANRGLWRDVAAQLRNRTMPPVDSKLSEEDRLRAVLWVENQLRQTARDVGEFAGAVALRRLNRREYHNTVRDLLGVDFNVSELFPADGTGGAGFHTNEATLYVPPMMMERYLEAAQQIADRVIITPDLAKSIPAAQLLAPAKEFSAPVSIYLNAEYDVRVAIEKKDGMGTLSLKVDDATPVPLAAVQQSGRRRAMLSAPQVGVRVRIARGLRNLSIVAEGSPVSTLSLSIQQKPAEPSTEKMALHYRFLGVEPGTQPLQPKKAAEQILR